MALLGNWLWLWYDLICYLCTLIICDTTINHLKMNKKTYFLIILSFLILPTAFAQANAAPSADISLYAGKDILYAGINNVVTLECTTDETELKLMFPDCKVEPVGTHQYRVFVPEHLKGTSITAKVTNDKHDHNELLTKKFHIVSVPNPSVFLAPNLRNGRYTVEEILHTPILLARMHSDFIYDIAWQVDSFNIEIVCDGESKVVACSGRNIPEQVCDILRSTKPGTIIFFQDIKVSSKVGTRYAENFFVRVK